MTSPPSNPEASYDHDKPRCFVAYPSTPPDRMETIETAIEEIHSGGIVDIVGWTSLAVSGRLVIDTICDEIKKSQVFIADVTGLNPNVLFELGYAIAHRKRIWLLLNPQIVRARASWDRFFLTTIGFTKYTNSCDITTQFYRDEPYKHLDQNLYEELLKGAGPPSTQNALLYLKCAQNTEASMRLARRVSSAPMKSMVDDPHEMRVQPLSWYVQQVNYAFAVVCHLISTEYKDWELHNAKHALVAGLAHGRAMPMIMLAHEPYEPPLDYRDLLRRHRTAAEAEAIFSDWLLSNLDQYEKRIARAEAYAAEERTRIGLRDIAIGEPIAEFESTALPDYYVSTAAYTETFHSKYSIVVGRKGTGKTAMLIALADELHSDPRNQVCVIQPVGYELEGLLNILRLELPRAEEGYLVESFWKFLLYTELAKSVYDQLLAKPSYYVRSADEASLFEFIEQYQSIISPEFSGRLEGAVDRLRGLVGESSSKERRLKVSELLHNEMLTRLRHLLGEVLKTRARVTVLVDNLDKAWNANTDLQLLSRLLFGLLGVSRQVADEFERDASGHSRVDLSFSLFLRSDIHAAMLQFAKERDKLPVRLMLWTDPELLKRVIEERFINSTPDIKSPQEVWQRYFVSNMGGIPIWEYIGQRTLPRPRDLIYLVKSALHFAVNRGHTSVQGQDLADGEKQYSKFAIDSLIVETSATVNKAEDLLLYFVRSNEIVTEQDVLTRMTDAGIAREGLNAIVNLFGELTFIGFEVAPNRFEFLYDEQDARKFRIMAKKTADETTDGIRRFRIHPAFHSFLEITPNKSSIPGQMNIEL